LTDSEVRRIAIGERAYPLGTYAQELLTNLKIFDSLKSKLVYSNNVRQVLTYVETGNVDAGIVYITDAKESKSVRVGQRHRKIYIHQLSVSRLKDTKMLLPPGVCAISALRH